MCIVRIWNVHVILSRQTMSASVYPVIALVFGVVEVVEVAIGRGLVVAVVSSDGRNISMKLQISDTKRVWETWAHTKSVPDTNWCRFAKSVV